MKENLNLCSSVVRFNIGSYFVFFQPADGATLCFISVLYWREECVCMSSAQIRFLHMIHLSCLMSGSHIIKPQRINQLKWTEKKNSFIKQIICSLQLGSAMLSKEQGSSNKQKGRCKKTIDISLTIYWLDFF